MRDNTVVIRFGPRNYKGYPKSRVHVLGFVVAYAEARRIKAKYLLKKRAIALSLEAPRLIARTHA
jgi:hypothetical protein